MARRTGATRHRSERRWGRERLILQYEFTGMVTRLVGPHPDTNVETWWRDATTADLSSEAPTPMIDRAEGERSDALPPAELNTNLPHESKSPDHG